MNVSEQVDNSILTTPTHEIRQRLEDLEQESGQARWVSAHAGAAGLATLALSHFGTSRLSFLSAALGNSLLVHALRGAYPLLPVFHLLGARPRSEIDRERYGLEQRLHPRDPLGLVNSGRRSGNRFDRVRRHTAPALNQRIDEEIQGRLHSLENGPTDQIRARLDKLEREWDIDQVMQAKTAVLVDLGLALGRRDRRGYLVAGVGFASLLSHAVTGWSPSLPLLRRLGLRTRREIDREKFALLSLL